MIESDNKSIPKVEDINAEKKLNQALRRTLQKLFKYSTFFFRFIKRGYLNMEHEQSKGTHPMMHSKPMPDIWGFLTEEQKKKVAVIKMEMKIHWMEMKISAIGKMIELKKKAIVDIKQVQEMINPKK